MTSNLMQGKQNRAFNWTLFGFSILVGLIYLFFTSNVYASDFSDVNDSRDSFSAFMKVVATHVSNMEKQGHIVQWFVNAQFITFATYRLTMVVGQYAFDRADLVDVFSVIMLIAIVQIFISFYSVLLSGLFSWANDIAGAIQKEVMGNDNTWFTSDFIAALWNHVHIVDNISAIPSAPPIVQPSAGSQASPPGVMDALGTSALNALKTVGGWGATAINTVASIGFSIVGIIAVTLISIAMWLLNIVIFIGIAWSIWGFALAKLLGLFFIPFLLIEKLAPLFDGWLKFLIGFLVYGIIIKVNAALVTIMIASYFGVAKIALPLTLSSDIYIVADRIENLVGLFAMIIVSLLAVLSTGGFATAIAAGVGGFGAALAIGARSAAIVGVGGAPAPAAVAKAAT